MNEIWKDVKGYEGLYKVSNTGKVFSCKSKQTLTQALTGTTFNTRPGYYRVMLYKGSSRKNVAVHRLVAETFIPNPENKPQVNHIDHNTHNNNVNNLEWVTQAENIQAMYAHKSKNKGEITK